MSLLEVKELKTFFHTRRGVVKAVNGISFSVDEGETLGLVGESGCGKSVTCLSILRVLPQPAGKIAGGEILFCGQDLLRKSEGEMREIRGRQISIIPQDPTTSLNPVFSLGFQVGEAIALHQKLRGMLLWKRAKDMLNMLEVSSPEQRLQQYPHQISGGIKQRVVAAIALSCEPSLLLADEPTTSLDVTTQAHFLSMLKKIQLQQRFGLIFVTHDFGIMAKMCDKVAVMYAGKVVERGSVRQLFDNPAHPYTRALIDSIPRVDREVARLLTIEGQAPALYNLPPGCSFAPRCSYTTQQCRQSEWPPEIKTETGHWLSCWRYG